ncbi:MAG: helix-turn-helix domain-containing protein [Halobacteriales archaeon]|nr:helix-turn-helix domain-containing protein [Halobacteriales archaeon]
MSHTVDSEESSPEEPDGLTPAAAFSLLGNDTRIAILQAMLDADAQDSPVPFSTLYDRVDLDDSGQFNYHLQKLTEHFIRQTDDGYEFRYAGWKVVRSVFAGTFNERAQLDPFETDGTCYSCGGTLIASYANEFLTIECAECGARHVRHSFPPGGLDGRSPAELLQAFHHHVRHHYCLAADGVCPECMGPVTTSLVPGSEEILGLDVRVDHVCERCQNWLYSAVGVNLLDTVEVLTFHAERGVDLSTEPFWQFSWCVSDTHTTVLDTDPMRIRLSIPLDGDELRVVVAETADNPVRRIGDDLAIEHIETRLEVG